jgi:hypothetical protein
MRKSQPWRARKSWIVPARMFQVKTIKMGKPRVVE